jgi:hypothetical protein
MTTIKHLTRQDLDTLTRTELLARIEEESAYWDRKSKRGLSDADAAAMREFSAILHAAMDPGAAIEHAAQYVEGRGDNGYWSQKPGTGAIPPQER